MMDLLRRAGGAINTETTRRCSKRIKKSFEDGYFASPRIGITDAAAAERLRDSHAEQNTELSDQET